MKRELFTLTCLVLAGCKANTSDSLGGTTSTADLLQTGSPQACSTREVRETVIDTVKPSFRPDDSTSGDDIELGLSQFSYGLDVITLESVDSTVHNVTCEANLVVTHADEGKREFSIRYVVKPSVDDPQSFVVSVRSGNAKIYLQASASEEIAKARDERLADEMATAPPQPVNSAAVPSDTPTQGTLEDVTNAINAAGAEETNSNRL